MQNISLSSLSINQNTSSFFRKYNRTILYFFTCILLAVSDLCSAQETLHSFNYSDGANPVGDLYSDGTYLYGTTTEGGDYGAGVIFRIKPDGTSYTKLYDFDFTDGQYASSSLISDGSYLYGTTQMGGDYGFGVVYKIKPDGTDYTKLYDFDPNIAMLPIGGLLLKDDYLYGMTTWGDFSNVFGTIFKIKTDGTDFAKLFDFDGSNGGGPMGSLITDGTYLYGTTEYGGNISGGVIFKIKPDGTDYTKLLDFDFNNGYNPTGALISDGNYLYGTTRYGGDNFSGVIFKIKPDGTDYTKLLDFDGYNGYEPFGSLVSDGVYLYGNNAHGLVFKIKPDGTGHAVIAHLSNYGNYNIMGSLIIEGGACPALYGMSNQGGDDYYGSIFKVNMITSVDTIRICGGTTSHTWIDGNTYTSNDSIAFHIYTGGASNGCDSLVYLYLKFSPNPPPVSLDLGGSVQLCNSSNPITISFVRTNSANKFSYGDAPNATSRNSTESSCNCPPGYVVTGYQGRSGGWLDQFSLLCRELLPDNTLGATVATTVSNGVSNGGSPRGPFQFVGDTVIVGFIVYKNGTYLNGIRAIAQPLAVVLAGGSNRIAPIYLPIVGNAFDAICNPDTLLLDDGELLQGMIKWDNNNSYSAAVGLNSYGYSSYSATNVVNWCNSSYQWSSGETTNSITVSTPGTYTFIVTNDNGCSTASFPVVVQAQITTIDSIACNSIIFKGNTITDSGIYFDTLADVSGCDSIIQLNLTINNSTFGTHTVTACDSYTWIDGNTYTQNNNTATFLITNGNSNNCDSTVTLNLTINNSTFGTHTVTACDSYTWIDGNTYTQNNNTATFLIANGNSNNCDSTVTLNLTINNSTFGTHTVTACDSYTWIDGNTYTQNNNTATFLIANGNSNDCDSTVMLNLTIHNATTGTHTVTACDSYTWIDGNTYTQNNNTATFLIANGNSNDCDSTVTLNLTIHNATTGIHTVTACDSYTWIDGNTYTQNNNTATFLIANGNSNDCDSTVTLNLTIHNATTGIHTVTACDSYTWIDGNTYTQNNNTATFLIANGNSNNCDSTVTLNLTINNSTFGTHTVTACDSYTWIDGNTYTQNNNTATFLIANGNSNDCDSTVTLNLTIHNATTGIHTVTACDSYTWIDGNTYTQNNNTATFLIANGNSNNCDSTVTLNLTINNSTFGTHTVTACDSYTWIDGNTYTQNNNTATFLIANGNSNNCDSTVTLNLTIHNATTGIHTVTACDSYTWIDGNTYTQNNNTATFLIANGNSNNCDSTVTLNLTIYNATTGIHTVTACDSYTWIDGNTYTQNNNTATFLIANGNSNNCDSTVTLNLTINNSITENISTNICEGDSFDFNGVQLTLANQYFDTVQTTAGCDSIIILTLTVNDLPQPTIVQNGGTLTTTEDFENYQWLLNNNPINDATEKEFVFTQNGNYKVIVTDAMGCSDTSSIFEAIFVDVMSYISDGIRVTVFPNPAENIVHIIADKNIDAIEIYNELGQLLDAFHNSQKQTSIDIHTYSKGVYILKVSADKNVHFSKVVKY